MKCRQAFCKKESASLSTAGWISTKSFLYREHDQRIDWSSTRLKLATLSTSLGAWIDEHNSRIGDSGAESLGRFSA
jgi:hypothetical protein